MSKSKSKSKSYFEKFTECFKSVEKIANKISYNKKQDRYVMTELEFRLIIEAAYILGHSDGYVHGVETVEENNKTKVNLKEDE